MRPTPMGLPALDIAHCSDPADDLVAGHAEMQPILPLGAGLVDIGVANAAAEGVDLDVNRAGSRRSRVSVDRPPCG